MSEAADVYSDGTIIGHNPFGAIIRFTKSPLEPGKPEDVAIIRMSFEHLKVLSYSLRQQVRKIEAEIGPIVINPAFLNQIGIPPEDFRAWTIDK